MLLLSSCTPTPDPIAYGSDICHFCKMTIVDQQHAAELVTKKGKIFKFDAIECLLNFQNENTATEFAFRLVNVFESPKELNKAEESFYLISKAIPSPMGANLTAFKNEAAVQEALASKGGKILNWQTLQQHFDSLVLKDF